MKYIIDRFEDDIAVCECCDSGEMVNIDRSLFLFDVKEGDAVLFENGNYISDNSGNDERKNKSRQKLARLFARSKKKGE